MELPGLYSQHFIFSVTYKWAQYPKVLHYTRLEMLDHKHSGIYGSFLIY
jgi:hypothetical protein